MPERRTVGNKQALRTQQVSLAWSSAAELEPMFVDQLHVQKADGHWVLTFGQVRAPLLTAPQDAKNATAEIRPVTQLILTDQSFKKVSELFRNVMPEEENR